MKANFLVLFLITLSGILLINLLYKSDSMELSSNEFKQKIKNDPGVVIDVRTDEEYNEGHLAIADHQYDLNNGEFRENLDHLNKSKTYYLYCRTGNRSGKAAKMMKDKGFEKVYNVGGYHELADAGFESKK